MLTNTILNVPYKDKDQAKQLGAKWDPKQKAWYVPPGTDVKQFKDWLPKDCDKPKLIINKIGLIRTITPCWSCKGFCTVHALYAKEIRLLPNDNKKTKKTKKSKKAQALEKPVDLSTQTGFFVLSDINLLQESFLQFLILRCPNYRKGKVNVFGEKLYRNHCDHCSMGLSDGQLHKKGKAFNPQKLADLQSMQFIDLMFFDDLEVQSDYMDYSENKLFSDSIEFADYLTDFI